MENTKGKDSLIVIESQAKNNNVRYKSFYSLESSMVIPYFVSQKEFKIDLFSSFITNSFSL